MSVLSPSLVWLCRKSVREPAQLGRPLAFAPGLLRTAASPESAGCSLSRGEKLQNLPFYPPSFSSTLKMASFEKQSSPISGKRGLGKLVTLVVVAASSCAGFCPLHLLNLPTVWGSPATADLGCSKFPIFSLPLISIFFEILEVQPFLSCLDQVCVW